MVQGLDASFAGAAFVGYHSAAGSNGNPLAHTFSGSFARVELNGVTASEFVIYAYAAASVGVPVVFLSGDKVLCEEAQAAMPRHFASKDHLPQGKQRRRALVLSRREAGVRHRTAAADEALHRRADVLAIHGQVGCSGAAATRRAMD